MLQNILSLTIYFLRLLIIIQSEAITNKARKAHRIIGGRSCAPGEFRSLVNIMDNRGFPFCGGSIINNIHILTAGHCVEEYVGLINPGLSILAGDVRIDENVGKFRQTINVRSIKIHPKFDSEKLKNDIAILILENQLVRNNQIDRAPLSDTPPRVKTKCITAGWGDTTPRGLSPTSICLATAIHVHTKNICRYPEKEEPLKNPLDASQICVGDLTGKNDSCQGDSGGPLYCGGKQYGVVSYGSGCATKGHAAVYTNVAYFRKWILDEIKKTSALKADNAILSSRRQTSNTVNSRNYNTIKFTFLLVYSAFRHLIFE